MIKFPKSIKLAGHHIKVLEIKTDKFYGEFSSKDNQIKLMESLTESNKASALLHELIHACFLHSELYTCFSKDEEETIVKNLETLLFQMIRDNPKLVEYLVKA